MIETPPSPRLKTGLLAVFLIGLQLVFAAMLLAVNVVAERAPGRLIDEAVANVKPTGAPGDEFPPGTLGAIRLPAPFCCAQTPVVVRTTLTAADAATPDLALLIPSAHDNALVYVDGELIGGAGAPSTETNTSRRPQLVRIPPRYSREGAVIDVSVQRAIGFAHLRPLSLGRYDELYPSYLALRLLRSDLPFINAVVAAFLAVFCVCAAPLLGARGLLLSLAGLAASWLLQHVWILVTDPPWSALTHALLYLIGFLGAVLFVVWFFIEWTSAFEPQARAAKKPSELLLQPWSAIARQRLGIATAGLVAIGAGLMLWRLNVGAEMIAVQDIDRVLGFLGLFAMAFCLVRLVAHILRGGMREPIEMASFLVVVLSAIADIVMVRFFSSYGVFLGVAAAFFPLALMISLAGRARGVFEAATANAERLNALVAERESEILANLEELQRRERATLLLEERARIMRDMHDGIGGQLLGLVLQAKANKLSGESLVQGLEESLADLRVIVDSLEQGDGSLATVLGAFRARIEPRVEAAGAQLIWEIGDVGETSGFGPDRALQLYRILQEACTNALKHGRPDRIAVTLARNDTGHIELSLSDNGHGFDPTHARGGRGLSNMRYRAERIGAQLRVVSSGAGTRVSLQL